MKKQLLILIFTFCSLFSFAQSSLDTLRLVLPVGHIMPINEVSLSSDDAFILTASKDKTARIYDVNSRKELQCFYGHNGSVVHSEFSPDGKKILTVSTDTMVRVFDVCSGKVLITIKKENNWSNWYLSDDSFQAMFHPNSQLLLTSSDSIVSIFDLTNGKKKYSYISNTKVQSVDFSANGDYLLIATKNCINIYQIETEELIRSIVTQNSPIVFAEFSFDGQYIVTSSSDSTASIYSTHLGAKLSELIGHNGTVSFAHLSFDNKFALTRSEDGSARIWNALSGSEIKKFQGYFSDAIFSHDGKSFLLLENDLSFGWPTIVIYQTNTGVELKQLIGADRSVNSIAYSTSGKKIIIGCDDNTIRIFDFNSGNQLSVIEGFTLQSGSIEFDSKNLKALTYFNKYENNSIGNRCLSSVLSFNIKTCSIDFSLLTDTSFVCDMQYSRDYKSFVLARSDLYLGDKPVFIYNSDNGTLNKSLQLMDSKGLVEDISYSPLDKEIIITQSDSVIRIFDSEKGTELIKSKMPIDFDFVRFNYKGDHIIATKKKTEYKFSRENLKTDEDIFIWNERELSSYFNYSPSCKYVFISRNSNIHYVYNVDLAVKQCDLLAKGDIKLVLFSHDEKKIFLLTEANVALIFDLETGALQKEFNGPKKSFLEIRFEDAKFSPNDRFVLINPNSEFNHPTLFDLTAGFEIPLFNKYSGRLLDSRFSSDSRLLITTDSDNKIIIWNLELNKEIYSRIQLENNNWLVKLPNSPYYMCSKDASKMLHYVTPSLKVIGFEQLDPVYNRPDIVLDSIGRYFGNQDKGMIEEYRKFWEKRIVRLGLDKEKLGKGDIAVPDAEIVGADDIAYENKEGKLDIKVAANDPKYPLRRFNVYVNEVPLYGSAGISIAHLKKQVWDTTVSVPLSTGENKIQVSVMNELGLENFKYPTYVNFTPTKEIVAKTYYIGIGVNEFKEAGHNLKYCVDDVTDLAEAFKSNSTVTKLFTNPNVTRENILKLKQYLKDSTTVNDKVIISCSSHGLLDDSLNFYLATHDVNFDNPKARGLKYEELEGLLDGIPARQKLLLLDACNSGENDKSIILKRELEQKKEKLDSNQFLAARGLIVKVEEENKSNFKKMNELFVNVRNNTGSVIISAAGGQESALEAIKVDGKTIENGAFTYSILECIKQNQGKELKVNTLKQYAEKRVEEITNGKQKPTSRQETMEVDWEVKIR